MPLLSSPVAGYAFAFTKSEQPHEETEDAEDQTKPADSVIEETARKILSGSKASKTALLVRFPNGDVLAKEKAADTLVEVIQHAGMEQVEAIGIMVNGENIVSRTPSKKYYEARVPPYFIKTHSSTVHLPHAGRDPSRTT